MISVDDAQLSEIISEEVEYLIIYSVEVSIDSSSPGAVHDKLISPRLLPASAHKLEIDDGGVVSGIISGSGSGSDSSDDGGPPIPINGILFGNAG